MMAKTTEEKIESVLEQIRQLENQKKRLIQEQKERERRARTKRLIERGAILESFIPEADIFTNEQVKAFLEKIIRTESARKALANLTAEQGEAAASALKQAQRNGDGGTQSPLSLPKGALIHPCGCAPCQGFCALSAQLQMEQAVPHDTTCRLIFIVHKRSWRDDDLSLSIKIISERQRQVGCRGGGLPGG